MINDEKALLIDRYINGKLEDTELWEFKKNVKQDPTLASEIELRRELYALVRDTKKMSLLKTITEISAKQQTRKFKINIHSRQLQSIAASIIVFMIIGAGLLSNYIGDSKVSNYEVYTEYFVDEGSLLTTRSGTESNNSSVESGVLLYSSNKYAEAISLFDENPNNLIARLYSGFSYMKLEQFDMAEKQFEFIIEDSDNIFIDQAEWNLGLSYLANNKTEQAIKIFTMISASNGAYSLQATSIIKELENK